MDIKQTPKTDFFGKDSLTPFIGQIEDVNDPKRAARVKVRCVGWHSKDKKELTTDDLPWARVSAPTTHAQQSRVGSKHGLLPGCWVWGFFLDGNDANDPMICGSFPFTARTSEKDIRTPKTEGDDPGRTPDSVDGFEKVQVNPRHPNAWNGTKNEAQSKKFSDESDNSGDSPSTSDSLDSECGNLKSQGNEAKEAKFRQGVDGNNHSQFYDIFLADGYCGNIPHAQSDIRKIMEEKMPSAVSRLRYGDIVWNKFTGSYINVNGLLAMLSLELCAILRMLMTQTKALQEETINRPKKFNLILAATERDGFGSILTDRATTVQDDIFHTVFEMAMDLMCGKVMSMLQEMEKGSGDGDDSDDSDGGVGGGSIGPGIPNPGAPCVSATIIKNFEVLIGEALDDAVKTSEEIAAPLFEQISRKTNTSDNKKPILSSGPCGGYGDVPMEDITKIIDDAINENDDDDDDDDDNDETDSVLAKAQEFAGALSMIGAVTGILQFSMMNKFAIIGAKTHNQTGDGSLSLRARLGGCRAERIYNTVNGAMAAFSIPSIPGAGGSNGSGGGNGGSTGNGVGLDSNLIEQLTDLGWGGSSKDNVQTEVTYQLCEDAYSDPFPLITSPPDDDSDDDDSPGDGTPTPTPTPVPTPTPTPGPTPTPTPTPSPTPTPGGGGTDDGDNGGGGVVIGVTLPSTDDDAADNFDTGTPNVIIVVNPGGGYTNPEIYIPGYEGTPVPVVDPDTGELVTIITNPISWDPNKPGAPISIIPTDGRNPAGGISPIYTNNPNYDVVVTDIFVGNTGFEYTNPTVRVADCDNDRYQDTNKIKIINGRIVDVEINSMGGFRRLPCITVTDETGYGAKLFAIISIVPKDATAEEVPVQMVFCPGKNNINRA